MTATDQIPQIFLAFALSAASLVVVLFGLYWVVRIAVRDAIQDAANRRSD